MASIYARDRLVTAWVGCWIADDDIAVSSEPAHHQQVSTCVREWRVGQFARLIAVADDHRNALVDGVLEFRESGHTCHFSAEAV